MKREDAVVACLLGAVVLVMGFWPWHPLVDLFPHGSDATKWVQESHPSERGWFRYVFFTRHFIGYRPIAALTYTLNGLVSGYEPWAYRLTDVAIHALVPVGLFLLYRKLTGDRSAWGLLAPIVFLLHPATEDVVPHLARRSYSLSCALALAGLIAFVEAARRPDRPLSRHTWLATGLFVLALASNEVAGVVVVLLPLLALHLRPAGSPSWRSLLLVAPTFLGTALLLAVRLPILGYTGGYHKRYFAYTANGQNLLREVADDTPYVQILEAAWRYALFPSSASGDDALLTGAVGLVAAIAIALFYGWAAFGRAAVGWRDPERRLPGLLLLWLFGYTLLYALTRNWFWRQAYPMLLPLSLLVAVLARDTFRTRRPALTVLAFLPQLALLLSLGWHSPAVRGLDTSVLNGPIKLSASIHDVRSVLEGHPLHEPAVVYLAVPTRAGNAHMVRIWSDLLHKERRITFRVLAVSEPTAAVELDDALLELGREDGEPVLRLAGDMTWSDVARERFGLADDAPLPLAALSSRGARSYVYWRDRDGGRLLEVPPPDRPVRPAAQRSR